MLKLYYTGGVYGSVRILSATAFSVDISCTNVYNDDKSFI